MLVGLVCLLPCAIHYKLSFTNDNMHDKEEIKSSLLYREMKTRLMYIFIVGTLAEITLKCSSGGNNHCNIALTLRVRFNTD